MFITEHLFLPTLDGSAKSEIERAALKPILYMAFQHLRFTRTGNYLTAPWALTPHFHLFLRLSWQDSYFLWHCLLLRLPGIAGYSPVGCSMLSGLSSPVYTKAIARLVIPQPLKEILTNLNSLRLYRI